jgi:methylmalonyl-CoA mutase
MKDSPSLPPSRTGERLFAEFEPADYAQWKAEAEHLLKGAPFDKKMFTRLPEGITLASLYRSEDVAGLSFADAPPGSAPYARGSRAWRGELTWLSAQRIIETTPENFKKLFSMT